MNWWGIIGVVFLSALVGGIWTYKSSGKESGAFGDGFLYGGLGCLSMLFKLFMSLLSLYILYLLFTWIFG